MNDYLPYVATAIAVGAVGYLYMGRGDGPIRRPWNPSTPEELSPYEPGSKVFAIESDGRIPIRLAKRGVASIPPECIYEVFRRAAKNGGDRAALKWENAEGQWVSWTWKQYHEECEKAARAFIHLGLQPHESVNIIGFNSPEWFFANNGAVLAGGKAAGIYTTNGPDACAYITEHSEARVVVVENEAQLAKFLAVWDRLPRLKAIVVYRPANEEAVNRFEKNGQVMSWKAFIAHHNEVPEAELQKRYQKQNPGDCCLLIYTSGTTGPPKAVMISQDNIFFTAQTLLDRIGATFGAGEEVGVSYLPLSHIAAQMVDIWNPINITAFRPGYFTVWFARPDALKGTLATTLKTARPTFFFGVPRVWEKMMEGIKAVGAKNTGLKKSVATWAKNIGATYWKNHQTGGSGAVPAGYGIAKKIVFSKVRLALGLDRSVMQYTGAAPMGQEVFDFFASLDIPVFELYGMSECTGPQTVTFHNAYRAGTTGTSLLGTELKLDHVDGRDKPGEGEICYRGRHIMMGYMKQLEKTRETIDPEGFLHSGDVGRLDADGFLSITGRIEELIITAGGENIAPVPIENAIKLAGPALSNVMMVGDRRKYNVCLITLKAQLNAEGMSTDALAGEALAVNPAVTTVSGAKKDPVWQAYIQKAIDTYNKEAVSQAQKIQKFAILDQDFSIAHELTPTLKLKRDVTAEKYAALIDSMYVE